MAARVDAREWIDTATEYGTSYEYSVQTALKAGAVEAESEVSERASIVPRDVFPPAAPKDLAVIAATGAVELGWEPNIEADLAGYCVYRSKERRRVRARSPAGIEAPSYSDRNVEAGAKYVYAVTAVDRTGNQSPRSAPAEIEIR